MSIMEKNLPIAESLGEGDKVRIVTSEGNSKQIDAGQIGGGGALIVEYEKVWDENEDGYVYTPSKSTAEIAQAYNSGIPVFATIIEDGYRGSELSLLYAYEDEAYYGNVSVNLDEYDNRVYKTYGLLLDHREYSGEDLTIIETPINDIIPFGNFAPVILTLQYEGNDSWLTGGYGDISYISDYPYSHFLAGRNVIYFSTLAGSIAQLYQLFKVQNHTYYFMSIDETGTIDVKAFAASSTYPDRLIKTTV